MTDYSSAYLERGIWETWHDLEFSDYVGKHGKLVKDIVDKEYTENILLYGYNGNGKTMLMNLAMKELLKKKFEVYVIDFRHLMKEYIASWRSDDTKIPRLLTVDYLAIDDIGKEFKSEGGVSADLATATLDYVLRYRLQRKKSTWLTSNMPLGDIEKIYGGHIASLLKRDTITIEFLNPDFGDNMIKMIKSRDI